MANMDTQYFTWLAGIVLILQGFAKLQDRTEPYDFMVILYW